MTSTLGIKKIQYPNGTNIATLDSSGSIAFAGAITGTLATAAQPNITSVGTLTGFTSTGIDDNADAVAITINSSENVGIGTTTVAAKLDIRGITGASTNAFLVGYGSNGDNYYTSGASGQHIFRSANTERVRIDASGNLLVGTTNANPAEQNVAGIGLLAGNSISVTDDGGAPIQLNRKSSDGSIAIFRRDGSSKGNIGTNSGDLYIAGTTHGIKFDSIDSTTMYLRPTNASGTNVTAQIDLGQAGNVFRDAYVSGGVYFAPNAYPANYLNDYEEGTFTPIMEGTSGDPSVTYTLQSGYYTKIGKQVTWIADVRFSAWTGGAGTLRINQLPFTANGTGSGHYQGNVHSSYMYQGTQTTNGGGYHVTGDTKAYFTRVSDGYSTVSANSINNTAGHLMLGGTYFTNS